MRKSNDDFVRERAELAGLTLSDEQVRVVRIKWEETPFCRIDDLIQGLLNLSEQRGREMLAATNQMPQNASDKT